MLKNDFFLLKLIFDDFIFVSFCKIPSHFVAACFGIRLTLVYMVTHQGGCIVCVFEDFGSCGNIHGYLYLLFFSSEKRNICSAL